MKLLLIPILVYNFYSPNLVQDWAKQTIVAEYSEGAGDPYTLCMEFQNISDDHWSYEANTSPEFKAACNVVEFFE